MIKWLKEHGTTIIISVVVCVLTLGLYHLLFSKKK